MENDELSNIISEPQDPTGGEETPGEITDEGTVQTPAAEGEFLDDIGEEPTKQSGIQKKFSKYTSEITDLKQKVAFLEGQLSATKTQPQPETPQKKELKPEDFDSYAEFEKAEMKEEFQGKIDALEAKISQRDVISRQETNAKQAEACRAKYDDFDEIVRRPNLAITPELVQTAQGEHFVEIMYQLAKNPSQMARIASLPPRQMAREVAAIELRLKAAPNKKPKKEIEPTPTVSGGGASSKKRPEEMSQSEYLKYYDKQQDEKKRKEAGLT